MSIRVWSQPSRAVVPEEPHPKKIIHGFRSELYQEGSRADANEALRVDEVSPARNRLEKDSVKRANLSLLKLAMAEGDLETAHRITEKLCLREYLRPEVADAGAQFGADGKRRAHNRLKLMQGEIARLTDEIDQAGRKLDASLTEGTINDKDSDVNSGWNTLSDKERERSDLREAIKELEWCRKAAQTKLKEYMVTLKQEHPEIAILIAAEPIAPQRSGRV